MTLTLGDLRKLDLPDDTPIVVRMRAISYDYASVPEIEIVEARPVIEDGQPTGLWTTPDHPKADTHSAPRPAILLTLP